MDVNPRQIGNRRRPSLSAVERRGWSAESATATSITTRPLLERNAREEHSHVSPQAQVRLSMQSASLGGRSCFTWQARAERSRTVVRVERQVQSEGLLALLLPSRMEVRHHAFRRVNELPCQTHGAPRPTAPQRGVVRLDQEVEELPRRARARFVQEISGRPFPRSRGRPADDSLADERIHRLVRALRRLWRHCPARHRLARRDARNGPEGLLTPVVRALSPGLGVDLSLWVCRYRPRRRRIRQTASLR